jgi:hypothetical protein
MSATNSTEGLTPIILNEKAEDKSAPPPPPPAPSALRTVLLQARRDLWSAQPRFLAVFLNPIREYIVDPSLAISSILLPALLPPTLDDLLAKLVSHSTLVVIHLLYSHTRYQENEDDNMRDAAKNSLLHGSTGQVRVVLKPPTDLESAFQGAVSFAVSAIGDIVGLFANPKKMRSWVDAMGQFNGFLEASGVGSELQEVRIVESMMDCMCWLRTSWSDLTFLAIVHYTISSPGPDETLVTRSTYDQFQDFE